MRKVRGFSIIDWVPVIFMGTVTIVSGLMLHAMAYPALPGYWLIRIFSIISVGIGIITIVNAIYKIYEICVDGK